MEAPTPIPQAPFPPGYRTGDVQLEMSLKPFWDSTSKTREAVCREVFSQWLPLCRYTDTISIMLWIGDGSEILEYAGDVEAEFEWGRYLGAPNSVFSETVPDTGDPGHSCAVGHVEGRDPKKRGVHSRSYLYRKNPARLTFRWLRELVADLKRIGGEMTGKPIVVGETFDIGPEFAVSRFKYDWHPEVCGGGALFGGKFIRCDVPLRADDRRYAGFPEGIPEGTSVGTFLGRQTERFFDDIGFDFLWLSNGFGFALEPWALTGAIFDGEKFDAGLAESTARKVLKFWQDLRVEMPITPIRTRGTNLATGIDLGSDASPISAIFQEIAEVDAPVNSPWAALDGDVGLELAGWMSHIARLPHPGYRFRYYIHDPWWNNSPWLDRYQRQPFDIFLPLAVSRLRRDGSVEPPRDLAFLSVDDSHGRMPANVPMEVTTHILHAREFAPDAPGPLVWAYPWDPYHELVLGERRDPALPFFGDWFVRGLITHTLPLNTVADAAELLPLLAKTPEVLAGSVLLAPTVPERFGFVEKLLTYAEAGGRVIFYGPLNDSPGLRAALELELGEPLDGDFTIAREGGKLVRHLPLLSAGGWCETGSARVVASGLQNGQSRAAAALREYDNGGQLGWIRGSLATAEYDPEQPAKIRGPRLVELPADRFFPTEKLGRELLARMDFGIGVQPDQATDADPMLCLHRHRNAFVFSGYQPAGRGALTLRHGLGAPLFVGAWNFVEGDISTFIGPVAWQHICRVFVRQADTARIECRIIPPIQHGYTLRILVSGVKNATVHFLPEPGTESRLEVLRNPKFPYLEGEFETPSLKDIRQMQVVTVENVSGEILFSW